MRFLIASICLLFGVTSAWAEIALEPLLNKVTLQLTAEQWVATKSALVNVGINASVSDVGLEKIQSQVMQKLNKLASKDWHLLSFDRNLDKSGLEHIQITAQARLLETELSGLRDKAKSISKPGETYTIENIQFTPSDEETKEANNTLRQNIYEQVQAEIARLNKVYSDQKYYVHDINFISGVYPAAAPTMMYKMGENAAAPRTPLTVGDKLRLNATVVLAASPDPNLMKLMH